MISRIRHSVYFRVLWGLVALYLLNISVDTADPYPDYIPEVLTINDQESFVEFFLEKILGFENAIAEYDDHDTEDHNKKKNSKIDVVALFFSQHNADNNFNKRKQTYPNYSERLTAGYCRLDIPPPKA
ncbi:hypothetical protein QQ020_22755 [Fulvivirgaceae bacterium BMA12]|uniref:Uncharacterized protein n=1 Tax=Agaribacillus aureus TaxID=3051825 RepID=A0ABT8LAX6_9BACT|nr:hypothetical protein [Fulvivirgaceae bacterium BMA12]